jgi:hypothetical protein
VFRYSGNLSSSIYKTGFLGDSMPRRVTEVPNQLSWQIISRVPYYNLAVDRHIKRRKCSSIFLCKQEDLGKANLRCCNLSI